MQAIDAISFMDRRLSGESSGVSAVYSGGSTTWTLPYTVAVDGSEGDLRVALLDTAILLTSTRPAANKVTVAGGDYSERPVYIGVLYSSLYVPSTIYVRDRYGKPDSSNKLTLRRVNVLFAESTDIGSVIRRTGGKTSRSSKSYTRATDGAWELGLHVVNDKLRMELSSASAGGFALNGLVWEGDVHPRAQKV